MENQERLVTACYNGDHSLVGSLIREGVNVDCVDRIGGMTPLTTACSRKYTNIAKLLLQNGAQVNVPNKKGDLPLIMACQRGDFELAKVLLDHGADVNRQSKYSGNSALMMSCTGNYIELVDMLLEHGAQVNLQDSEGDSALTVTSWWGQVGIAQKLINHGAQVNLPDNDGKSALTLASIRDDISVARVLLENGADANLKSTKGKAALAYAESEEMVEFLMVVSVPQFIEVLRPIAHRWRQLGKKLGLTKATLDSFQTTIEEEESRLQAVMRAWSKQTHPQPTWRGLIRAVKSIDVTIGLKMKELTSEKLFPDNQESDQEGETQESDQEGEPRTQQSDEEAKHLDAVKLAMKIKGVLKHTLVHGVLVGPAGSGKSSLMSRLIGKMPSKDSPSTGVAKRIIQVKKSSSVAVNVLNLSSGPTWMKIHYDQEAAGLMIHCQEMPSPVTEQSQPLPEVKNTLQSTNGRETMNTHEDAEMANQSHVILDDNATLSYPTGYLGPMGVFKTALKDIDRGKLCELNQQFVNSWTLYLTDTGGQIEFQEVLPLLVSGPSIFFITFRLDQDLDLRFSIEYRLPDGGRSEPYESSLTVKEAILQTLASVASMGTFTFKDPQMKSTPLKPKVLIIGTHKDKLDPSIAEYKIKEIDEDLKKLILSTTHFHEQLVEFCSESQLIFTVNNFSEEDSDFAKIRSSVEKVIHRRNNDFTMSCPSNWLIFGLVLRQETIKESVISYDQCFAIAQDCGIMDHKEFNHVLWFLHTMVGLIRHFPTPDLKDVVIRDPQVLFDQVTHLIVNTFTFESVGVGPQYNEFKKQGIFSLEDFKSAIDSSNKYLSPDKLLLLLEQLQIVAPFKTDDGRMKYFLPCVLAHSDMCSNPVHSSSEIPPLLIAFECGYCPKGLAGALIVYLLTNEMESNFKWKLRTDQIFRDQVSFHVSPYDSITLKIHPTFLECVHHSISKSSTSTPTLNRSKSYGIESVCNEVREFIERGIHRVSSDLNIACSNANHTLTFFCQDSKCVQSNGPHPAIREDHKDYGFYLKCKRSGNTVVSARPTDSSVWFGEICQAELKPQNYSTSGQSSVGVSTPKHHSILQVDTSDSPPKRKRSSSRSPHDISSTQGLPLNPSKKPRITVPNLKYLNLLKWSNSNGDRQTLRLIQSLSSEWQTLGDMFGIPYAQQHAILAKHPTDIQQCCRDVFNHWLENPPPDYPASWEGLCELLCDLEKTQLEKKLKEALTALFSPEVS